MQRDPVRLEVESTPLLLQISGWLGPQHHSPETRLLVLASQLQLLQHRLEIGPLVLEPPQHRLEIGPLALGPRQYGLEIGHLVLDPRQYRLEIEPLVLEPRQHGLEILPPELVSWPLGSSLQCPHAISIRHTYHTPSVSARTSVIEPYHREIGDSK